MKLRTPSLLALTLPGLLLGLSAMAGGCSPDSGNGDGDTTDTTAGSGGSMADLKYTFCGQAAATCPPDVSGVDLTTPVSFSADVYPILTSSCSGGSGCHATDSVTGLGFGTVAMPLDAAGMQALVTKLTESSSIAPGTKNVEPGNWQNSLMMMKLDGCQNQMGLSCTVPSTLTSYVLCEDSDTNPNNCGDGMPQVTNKNGMGTANNPFPFPLADDKRNTIRAWIAQGAMNN